MDVYPFDEPNAMIDVVVNDAGSITVRCSNTDTLAIHLTEVLENYPTCHNLSVVCKPHKNMPITFPLMPENIRTLSICNVNISCLPSLPKTLEKITLKHVSYLKHLDLRECTQLRNVTVLSCSLSELEMPDTVEHVRIYNAYNLDEIQFPKRMVSLQLEATGIDLPDNLSEFPLTVLSLNTLLHSNCVMPNVPTSLVHLKVLNCKYTGLPANLNECSQFTHLQISGMYQTYNLPKMPVSLVLLDVSGMDLFTMETAELENCVRLCSIAVSNCNSLRNLPRLPPSVTDITLASCHRVKQLDVPPACTMLEVDTCNSLCQLIGFPTTLISVSIVNTGILNLPVLHEGIISLKHTCNRARSFNYYDAFPMLPKSLKRLSMNKDVFMKSWLVSTLEEMGHLYEIEECIHKNVLVLEEDNIHLIGTLQRLRYNAMCCKLQPNLNRWYMKSQRARIEAKYNPNALVEYLETNTNEDLETVLDRW